MDVGDWLQRVDSERVLAAYIIKRLTENGGTMHVARIQNELSDPCGVVTDAVMRMKRADIVKRVSCEGIIALVRPADRLRRRRRRTS